MALLSLLFILLLYFNLTKSQFQIQNQIKHDGSGESGESGDSGGSGDSGDNEEKPQQIILLSSSENGKTVGFKIMQEQGGLYPNGRLVVVP